MNFQALMVDAWIREAEEASRLVEDLENRIRNNNPDERLRGSARSKLLELGVKLDRLESLLHNPPSKPILTDQDLDFRWKMLSDIQLRTRAVALSFFAFPSISRPGRLPSADSKENCRTVHSCDQDCRNTLSEGNPELREPLVQSDEATPRHMQTRLSWLWKVCQFVLLILGSAALLVLLIIICAII